MKVALAQIDSKVADVKANLAKHLDFIEQAITKKADLIVFPELSLTGDIVDSNPPDVSLRPDSEPLQEIAEASQKIDIVIGLAERSKLNLYNRYNSAFYFSEGQRTYRHRKLFLVNYSVFDEGKHYVPGNNLEAYDSRLGRISMLVCNDVWHAASPYIAALDGAEMMIVPTNSMRDTLDEHLDIPTTWEHMNRAYSAMMGFYTVFVNRVGVRKSLYGDFHYWGGSEIIGPNGKVVVKAPYDDEALVFGEVDLEQIATQRYHAPIIRDARLWIFRQEINRLAAQRTGENLQDTGLTPEQVGTLPTANKAKKRQK
jgi:predicted amidohydrolase